MGCGVGLLLRGGGDLDLFRSLPRAGDLDLDLDLLELELREAERDLDLLELEEEEDLERERDLEGDLLLAGDFFAATAAPPFAGDGDREPERERELDLSEIGRAHV